MRTTVLVTGGAGYIGSHVCKALAEAGYLPVVCDNLVRGHRWAVQWGPLEVADIADRAALREIMTKHAIHAVVHLAAYAYVEESMRMPQMYLHNNTAGTLNLIDAMLQVGMRHLVFSSSCATFGIPQRLPIADDHPQRPINPYGESKLAIEKALRWYGDAGGLSWAALRYFNAAGADPGGDLGEEHDPETHLIPVVVQAALGRKPAITIYGADYPTPDGTAVRDYVHVSDLADAHVRALGYLLHGGASAAFNLGAGRGCSVRDIVREVAHVGGRPVPVRTAPRRPGDVPMLVADAATASSILGWRPSRSELSTIVATAWRWHARRPRPEGAPLAVDGGTPELGRRTPVPG